MTMRSDLVMHMVANPANPRPGDFVLDPTYNTLKTYGADGILRGVGGLVGGPNITHASVASNGANATYAGFGVNAWRAPQALQIVAAWWEPTGADSAVTNTSSYRALRLINAGADGTTSTALASVAHQTTQASNTTKALTLAANPTVPAGHIVAAQQITVGGAETNGTVLVAGMFGFTYRPV